MKLNNINSTEKKQLIKKIKILDSIDSNKDIKKLNNKELETLVEEIRAFLIENISKMGGHLASNLGVVELTLALHSIFDTNKDKIIWDVGHQSYVHKIITGRRSRFNTLRELNGLSGFPKVNEDCRDCFNTGHSSTSISVALGFAKARDIKKEEYSVISVIGDGALTGGMCLEALNNAGICQSSLIIILNDNGMSISKNVGALSKYLEKIRDSYQYIKAEDMPSSDLNIDKKISQKSNLEIYTNRLRKAFEELGFKYFGLIDGHNIEELIKVLSKAKILKKPVIIHVKTQKGKGYTYAEKKPHIFHSTPPFNMNTGKILTNIKDEYSDIFSKEIIKLAKEDNKLVAITAAMQHGTRLDSFAKMFYDRFFDVGIAEQHGVTFAAGLAAGGMKPVFCVYSSFLQRAYDQIVHDIALQNLNVIFAVDRAGIVGKDGETHQGLYDISFLRHIPNMTILSPCDYSEFKKMIEYAVKKHNGPIAIRYSKGKGEEKVIKTRSIQKGQGILVREGHDMTIIAVGNMVRTSLDVANILQKDDVSVEVINARFVKPLDSKLIIKSILKTGRVITIEDNTVVGGFGSSILELLNIKGIKINSQIFGFPDKFIEQGSRVELFKKYKLDAASIAKEILNK